jgi:protoporphyrinogen IX oxidase
MMFLSNNILWLRAFHVIAVIAWMSGMLYLPRLFVYHTQTTPGSAESERFKVMERRLLRAIMNPAMIAVWLFGILQMVVMPTIGKEPWMQAKLTLVLIMSGLHGYFALLTKKFARDANVKPARFYRILNEAPTVLMILIVILVIVQPF